MSNRRRAQQMDIYENAAHYRRLIEEYETRSPFWRSARPAEDEQLEMVEANDR